LIPKSSLTIISMRIPKIKYRQQFPGSNIAANRNYFNCYLTE
jgi:hypothetical protein